MNAFALAGSNTNVGLALLSIATYRFFFEWYRTYSFSNTASPTFFFALAEEPGLEPRPTQGVTCSGVRTLRADRYTTPLCAAPSRNRTDIALLCLELREQITR